MPTTKAQAKKATEKQPKLGEKTGRQVPAQVFGGLSRLEGFGRVEPGTYINYRNLRRNPTVALARAIFTAPIKAAAWSFERDDDVSDDILKDITDQVEPLRPWLLHNGMYALDYGHTDFEKVFIVDGGRIRLQKCKPLLVEETQVRVTDNGVFAGVRQPNLGNVMLPAEKVFHFTYDSEANNFNGRSWFENVRVVVNAWDKTMERMGRYSNKVSGIIPQIFYPPGEDTDQEGNSNPNEDQAQKVLHSLGDGVGVAIPIQLLPWAQDALQAGVPIAELLSWKIKFLEPARAHGVEFVQMEKHLEALIMRGLLVPERVGIEGQFGTKAEAGEHAQICLQIAEEVLQDFVRHVNWYIVDQLLALNYGERFRGKVRIIPEPLVNEVRAFIFKMIESVLSPQTVDVMPEWFDMDTLLDMTGLPKAAEVVTLSPAEAPPEDMSREKAEFVSAALRRIQEAISAGNGQGRSITAGSRA